MTAEIINLRRARKAKLRREAEVLADENRAKFGRSKHEREATRAEAELNARRLEAMRRESDDRET
ncbi:DUF4169 family protein [Hyphomicrobium sp. 1Nfss2.1]|uniref:DUF4169 family protein n=1 Tax=Hyphomicrobium sp. 1Nfss2.1 TaxID=3413936 RepID=UPI003C7B407D